MNYKLFYKVTLFVIGFSMLTGCDWLTPKNNTSTVANAKTEAVNKAGCPDCDDLSNCGGDYSAMLIPHNDIALMISNYNEQRKSYIDEISNKVDNRKRIRQGGTDKSISFSESELGVFYDSNIGNLSDARRVTHSFDSIQKFMCLVKKFVKEANKKNYAEVMKNVRLNFYYTVYPDSNTMKSSSYLRKIPKKYQHLHSFVIVPALYLEKFDIYVDIDPREPVEYTFDEATLDRDKGKYLKDYIELGKPLLKNQIMLSKTNSKNKMELLYELSKNSGSLCPPHCPSGG